jgi:anhydro-N-acetylmuramic acid kinase
VWHDAPHATWQFGQAAVIAERVGLPVVSDFRVRDVAAGGQGAPLVPVADAALFASATEWRALQNIGGIGNVTILPPTPGAPVLGAVRAFDTGPGVCVIDGVYRLLRPGSQFDRDGILARSGTVIGSVVDASLNDPFFSAHPPRSTGRELFSPRYIADFVARCRAARRDCSDADIVATAVAFTARSIAIAYERFVAEPVTELVLTGGGAKNPAIVAAIRSALPSAIRIRPSAFSDSRESVAFAYLGWLHLKGRPGNVRTATGAQGPRILGTYTPA